MSTAVLSSSHFKFLHESDLPVVPLYDRWHSGERLFQDRVQVREAIQGASAIFRPFLTPQHQDFVPGLNYIFVGSLDASGRPWVSMVCGPKGFMASPDIKTLEIQTRISTTTATSDEKEGEKGRARVLDPILDNLLHGESFRHGKKMWSAVALDFTNRRRNKFNGVVYPGDILKADPVTGEMHVRLTVEQSIGNCPKYITIREMAPLEPLVPLSTTSPQELFHYGTTTNSTFQGLSDFEQGIVRRADCLFIASRYIDESLADQTSGMDCNHRGGNPGWIRVDDDGKSIVFPDYSGNRFFNTLGNIAADPRVGLLFVDFDTGDCLHVTGTAQIFVGHESQALYPHSQRAVQVSIESAILNLHALPFRLVTKELSPYNPRTTALAAGTMLHDGVTSIQESANTATLERITRHSPEVASFEFRASRGIKYQPGQYAVLDFGAFNTVGYRHMAPDAPQSLNDDYIRTWTISSAPEQLDKASDKFSLTIKHKAGGRISTLLHEWAPPVEGGGEVKKEERRLTVPLMSVGGEFVLPTEIKRLLFISGGIGATPFIAMLRGLGKQKEQGEEEQTLKYDIRWITSATVVEEALPEILQEVVEAVGPQLSITVFLTRTSPDLLSSTVLSKLSPEITVETGRLNTGRLHDAVPDVLSRQVLLCGPDPFMEATREYLRELHVAPENIHSEEFNF
ncbi:hypothetical protein BGZ92_011888 [Podila epicladia]|nr:hypothetical protein BGZ92_011888 [Podila epicladia]